VCVSLFKGQPKLYDMTGHGRENNGAWTLILRPTTAWYRFKGKYGRDWNRTSLAVVLGAILMRCHASSICHANIIYSSFSLLKAIFFSLFSHLHVGLHACSWHIGALEPHQLFDSLLPLTQFGTAFQIGCSVWNRFIGGLESLFYHTVAGLSRSAQVWSSWFFLLLSCLRATSHKLNWCFRGVLFYSWSQLILNFP
jgi:hypothetical protein